MDGHRLLGSPRLIKLIYLKFLTEQDRSKGFELLRERFEIAIEGEVYCVPPESAELLDRNGVCYTVVGPDSLSGADGRRWRIPRQAIGASGKGL